MAGRLPAIERLEVFALEAEDVHQRAGQHGGIVGFLHLDLAHHLAHDDLDVLIGDFDALRAVDRFAPPRTR